MLHFAVLALLAASVLAKYDHRDYYSFNVPVGAGRGSFFSITGEGRITAVRTWEGYNSHIYGLQVRFGVVWSKQVGISTGTAKEFELWDGEAIVQVSGKYGHFISSLVFVTNMGRSMWVGQPSGYSFNMYANHTGSELVIISGSIHGGLSSLGAHWAVIPPGPTKVAVTTEVY